MVSVRFSRKNLKTRERITVTARLETLLSNSVSIETGIIEGKSKNYSPVRPDGVLRKEDNRDIVFIASLLHERWPWVEITIDKYDFILKKSLTRMIKKYVKGEIFNIRSVYKQHALEIVDKQILTIENLTSPKLSEKWVRYKKNFGSEKILQWSYHLKSQITYKITK